MEVTSSVGTLTPSAEKRAARGGPAWVYTYIALQCGCQLALLSSSLAPSRVFIRSAAFCASLLFLVLVPSTGAKNSLPQTLGATVMAVLALAALNPDGGAPLAVGAHLAFHFAILAPVFWVARLELTPRLLQRVLLILWAFHTVSSITGLLQVYFPGQFQPAMTVFIREKQALMIRLSSGVWVPRPMGLTDTPGGVVSSGIYAAMFAIGVVLGRPFPYARIAGAVSMLIAASAVYLSQVRTGVVVLIVAFICVVLQLLPSGRLPQLLSAGAVVVLVAIAAFEVSYSLAGETVSARLRTLLQADPTTVYQANRGMMFEYGIKELLPRYPLGAGLGHWGMIVAYFGKPEDNIGAEIQIVGWILDGGFPLLIMYSVAILTTIACVLHLASRSADHQFRAWSSIIVAYDVAAVAMCFSYPLFMTTSGCEFWLLNTIVLASNPALKGAQVAASPA